MVQVSPQKRKRRRLQLREAQRRRRARLKHESKTFLQIILSEDVLRRLRQFSVEAGKPLHQCASDLVEEALSRRAFSGGSTPTTWPSDPTGSVLPSC